MFVSLEALSGNYIDVYPESAQNLLNSLQIGHSVFLGADCFNATVTRLSESKYIQTTPAIASIGKRSGQRSVMKLTNRTSVKVYRQNNMNWTFFASGYVNHSKDLCLLHILRYPSSTSVWQWSSKVGTLYTISENDWISYSQETCNNIETAWASGYPSISVNVGMKQYEIHFLMDDEGHPSAFGKQCYYNKERWVRRALRNLSQFETPTNEESCALCLENFSDTPHMPWIKTDCNHTFHAVCIDRIRDRCPMCRTPF